MTDLVNTSFNLVMFVHVLLTAAILGCVGYRLIKGFAIGESIYKLDWQDIDNALQQDLIMVILRCQRPGFLHAGHLGYMTYTMIVTVSK
ncbi:hypothetical protein NQ314_015246 [Rhamnusium bicolor]|uniref:Uncharacterized protein n=1 Tax=Rhamnusium bicolor TaxID=1586634 RepID=A0AAV8X071_9CUCU|nr:hypothetical protein NQ314_015246 [Rhamnusium bicolor]